MFRELTRLYVAMTRAKTDLILSCPGTLSPFLRDLNSYFLSADWSEYVSDCPREVDVPRQLEAHRKFGIHRKPWHEMTGEQFLYSEMAIGLPTNLIAKIRELVDGVGLTKGRLRLRWRSMGSAADDYRKVPLCRPEWGPETGQMFEVLTELLGPASRQRQLA